MTDEDLAVQLVAAAVLCDNDLSLRIAPARALRFQPMQPLTFTYAVAERVMRAIQPDLTEHITRNGDAPSP